MPGAEGAGRTVLQGDRGRDRRAARHGHVPPVAGAPAAAEGAGSGECPMTQEIDHAEAKTLMQAALDGELDAVTQLRFDAHLAACPGCAAEHARLKALSTAVRTQATRHAAPADLRASLL